MDVTLHTASWTAMFRTPKRVLDERNLMPVRISVGRPRFWPDSHLLPVARTVTPYKLRAFKGDAFVDAYINRLETQGVDAIRAELTEIATEYQRELVLLCFEADPKDCHRGMFAYWWFAKTGERVNELEAVPADNPFKEAKS